MFAGNWTEQALNFVVFIILARLLGAEAFGLAAMAIVCVLLAEHLVRETFSEALIKIDSLEDGHLDAVFWSINLFSIALVALIVCIANPIAALFNQPGVAEYVIWATPTVSFIGASSVPVAILRRRLEFRTLAIRASVGVALGGAVGISMAIMEMGAWSLIAQHVVQVFVTSSLVWFAVKWRPGMRATRQHFRDVVGFSIHMVGLRTVQVIALNTPTVVIGSFLGPVALGQFTIAWRMVDILSNILIAPIRIVVQPAFSHLKRSAEGAGKLLLDVTGIASLVVFASFIGLAVIAGPAVDLFFGAEWMPGVPALQVLCLVGMYISLESLQQAYCIALGHAREILNITVLETLAGIALMIYSVDYGLVGVAISFVAVRYILWPVRFRIVSEISAIRLSPYLGVMFLPLVSSVAMGGAVLGWRSLLADDMSGLLLVTSSIMVGIIVYAALSWLTVRARILDLVGSVQTMRGGTAA